MFVCWFRLWVGLKYGYKIIWVNPNLINLIKWVKSCKLDTIHLIKRVTRFDLYSPFNIQVVLGWLDSTHIIYLINKKIKHENVILYKDIDTIILNYWIWR